MKVAYEGIHSEVRTSNQSWYRKILLPGLVLAILFSINCRQKQIRVAVTPEDALKANELAAAGDAAYERKEYYAALIKYLESYRLNPNSEYLCNRMGIAYSQLNLYGEARQIFRRAIFLNKAYAYPYNNLGSVYFAEENYKQAEKYFKKAISLNPKEASFHLNLGSLYLERKKRDRGMEEWKKGFALDPDIFSKRNVANVSIKGVSLMERHLFLAQFMAASGNLEAAIENLKLAFNNGFTDLEMIRTSPDFKPIRKNKYFEEFLNDVAIWLKYQPKDDVRPPLR